MNRELPPFEILLPGTFGSMEGDTVSFSSEDLEAIVAGYDRALHPAPIVVGHPALDMPAYGWVAALAIEDGRIVATTEHVESSFADAVDAKRYRKVSASLYPAEHPSNPKPGAPYLKHVGFLGAAAPGVKGLRPVSFSAADQVGCITVEEELNVMSKEQEAADAVAKQKAADAAKEQSFAEREAAIVQAEQDIEAQRAEVSADKAKIVEAEAKARHEAAVSFAEAQVTAGKLAPAGKVKVAFLHELLGSVRTTSFGEGDAAMTPDAVLRELFEGATPIISFGEIAKPETGDAVISFAAPAGHSVDPQALEIHNRAVALQSAQSGLTYLEAVKRASAA